MIKEGKIIEGCHHKVGLMFPEFPIIDGCPRYPNSNPHFCKRISSLQSEGSKS